MTAGVLCLHPMPTTQPQPTVQATSTATPAAGGVDPQRESATDIAARQGGVMYAGARALTGQGARELLTIVSVLVSGARAQAGRQPVRRQRRLRRDGRGAARRRRVGGGRWRRRHEPARPG